MKLRYAVCCIIMSATAGCGSLLAAQYDDARDECRHQYKSGTDDREECLDAAREKYRQKSSNLRSAVRGMQRGLESEDCTTTMVGNTAYTHCR
jgi:hypothetical protein